LKKSLQLALHKGVRQPPGRAALNCEMDETPDFLYIFAHGFLVCG
jgi:hypothetical protein